MYGKINSCESSFNIKGDLAFSILFFFLSNKMSKKQRESIAEHMETYGILCVLPEQVNIDGMSVFMNVEGI